MPISSKLFHAFLLLSFLILLTAINIKTAKAAVILQYHHVSNETPRSTSISPKQFAKHLQYLADEGYRVVKLATIIEAIKNKQPLPDKTVAITFDDAYLNILTNGKPLLDKHNYPFTIFVNPGIIEQKSSQYLSWQQLKAMVDDGVTIANHGFHHDSLARIQGDISEQDWLEQQGQLINKAENILKEKLGLNLKYYAYPYGEYTQKNQTWLSENGYVAFGQHSGAVGINTPLTNIPRFPASEPYDKLTSLKDKLRSLAFNITPTGETSQTIFKQGELTNLSFSVNEDDFNPSQLSCYVSGLGKQTIQWQNDNHFAIKLSKPLPVGRVRANCTAPSISKPGRYFWYSKVWLILKENGEWFPL